MRFETEAEISAEAVRRHTQVDKWYNRKVNKFLKKRNDYTRIFVAIYENNGINKSGLLKKLNHKPCRPVLLKLLKDYEKQGKIIIKKCDGKKGEDKIFLHGRMKESVKSFLEKEKEISERTKKRMDDFLKNLKSL